MCALAARPPTRYDTLAQSKPATLKASPSLRQAVQCCLGIATCVEEAAVLDELIKVIECLKKRIKEHREQIQNSESRTRITLIDPLLRSPGLGCL